MKKIVSLMLAVCMLFGIMTAMPVLVSASSNDIFTYSIYGDTAQITKCDSSASGNIVIPETLDGYKVTTIGEYSFEGCEGITGITLPDTITNVGDGAFQSCKALKTLNFPANLSNMGMYVFYNCSSLEAINVDSANGYYSSVDGVLFNKSKTDLLLYPSGKSDTSYTPIDTVTKICDNAFDKCNNLTSVTMNDSLQTIESWAFYWCENLKTVNISASTLYINTPAFVGCHKIEEFKVDENNPNFSSENGVMFDKEKTYLYYYPSGNERIEYNIPATVTQLSGYAFNTCSNLVTLNIPASLQYLNDNSAIYDCENLEEINVANGNQNFSSEDGVFFDKDKTKLYVYPSNKAGTSYTVPGSVQTLNSYAFYNNKNLTSVILSEGVTYINDAAFFKSNISEIHLPKSLYSISYNSFDFCKSLKNVYYNGTQDEWNNIDIAPYGNDPLLNADISVVQIHTEGIYNYKVQKDKATILSCDKSSISGELVIPDTLGGYAVTAIDDYVFFRCYDLTSVKLPESLTSIGNSVFAYCFALSSVTMYDNVTYIGEQAFSGCYGLESIDLSDNLEVISRETFCDTELRSVDLPEKLTTIEPLAFDGTYLTNITLPKNVVTFVNGLVGCSSLESINVDENNPLYKSINGVVYTQDGKELVMFPQGLYGSYTVLNGTTSIGSLAFGYSSVETVTIPSSVKTIKEKAFIDSDVNKVILSEGLETIEESAFSKCTYLESVGKIPDTVTSLGGYAFYNCTNLEDVTLPENITEIKDYTFYYCPLGNLTIPDKVTAIRNSAFYGTRQDTFVLPAGLTLIEGWAFGNCYFPYGIYFKGNAKQWKNIDISSSGHNCITNSFVTLNYKEGMDKVMSISYEVLRSETYASESVDFYVELKDNTMKGKVMVIALYNNDGSLVGITFKDIASTYENIVVPLPEDTWSIWNVTAKVMIWDNESSLAPLTCVAFKDIEGI